MASTAFLIDDSALDRQVISEQLRKLPVEVRAFDNGRKALSQVADDPPCVCVVDIYMPEMDGLEVIRSLRRGGYEGLVVAISGGSSNANFDVLKYAETFGADMVMKKPVNIERIQSAISRELPL